MQTHTVGLKKRCGPKVVECFKSRLFTKLLFVFFDVLEQWKWWIYPLMLPIYIRIMWWFAKNIHNSGRNKGQEFWILNCRCIVLSVVSGNGLSPSPLWNKDVCWTKHIAHVCGRSRGRGAIAFERMSVWPRAILIVWSTLIRCSVN